MIVKNDFSLRAYNSYRVDAIGGAVYFPETDMDFVRLFGPEFAGRRKLLLGGGYNVILTKEYYPDEIFIIIDEHFARTQVREEVDKSREEKLIYAQAGQNLKALSELAYVQELTGLEYFLDIPGSLGGAIYMNAGSKGEDICSLLDWVRYLDTATGEIHRRTLEPGEFGYRMSIFQSRKNLVVLDCELRLPIGDTVAIREKMDKNKALRWSMQPRDYPNAGSVFKRPPGHYVGQLIEELGLKGYQIGGAAVSEKHAGFIVNKGGATGLDVQLLIKDIQARVLDAYNVELEVEQQFF
ncbi:MAG: UDP-N-acetylmuramate dehydrogenase [Lewinella sp.]